LLVNPPAVKVDAPPKVVDRATAFGELAGGYDEDEEGDEDDVNHPFSGGTLDVMQTRPSDMDSDGVVDTRYIGEGSLLHLFIGMLTRVAVGGDLTELIRFRDLRRDDLAGLIASGLVDDEISQMISIWDEVVSAALVGIKTQLMEAQDAIWGDVPKVDGAE